MFHFRTLRLQSDGSLEVEGSVVDDSRLMGCGPFELLVGREFKLAVWEEMLQTMLVGEVARFYCPFQAVVEYPRVSAALRTLAKTKAGESVESHHQCSFAALHGTGQMDLDLLTQQKLPLAFEVELLESVVPGGYKADSWAMSTVEKLAAVPSLKEQGNLLYKAGDYHKAVEKYFEALSYLEELSIREKPQSEDWREVMTKKVPLLLNYAQCKLLLKDYADVIRHTTTVLEFEPDNVKALFRRGKANAAVWNTQEARADFQGAASLDKGLAKTVEKELVSLEDRLRAKEEEEKAQWRGKLFS